MSATAHDESASGRWVTLHTPNVRICHWINVIACGYLFVSGVHIFLDFPELYWGHTGYQGYPAIFKLSDWGLSWDEAGELGNRMWGRNYHVTFAWVFVLNGLVYVGWNLRRRRLGHLVPSRADLTGAHVWAELRAHLRWPRPRSSSDPSYGTVQQLSYLLLIFVFVPGMILSGMAQSPGLTAAMPWLLDLFGGRQSARTLHAVGTLLLVLFVVVHVLEVLAVGGLGRVRAMITGKLRMVSKEES